MTRAQSLSHSLRQFVPLIYILAWLAAIGAFGVGWDAGSANLSTFDRDMETTWRLTGTVVVWWGFALGCVIQGHWLALITQAVAELLAPTAAEPPSDAA